MTQNAVDASVETLVGRIVRSVIFSDGMGKQRRMPAGTEVYVRPARERGQWVIRIPGTLFEQKVYITVVEPV